MRVGCVPGKGVWWLDGLVEEKMVEEIEEEMVEEEVVEVLEKVAEIEGIESGAENARVMGAILLGEKNVSGKVRETTWG